MRHGSGKCTFEDGIKFQGLWEDGCWVQTAADPATTRVSGAGLKEAKAGQTASFLIEVTCALIAL